jgi:hypothetical protein
MGVIAVREATELCISFLDSASARGSEVESFLTQYLLMASYAAFEEEIESMIGSRSALVADLEAANYVRVTLDNVKRGLKIGELAGLIGRFSETAKEQFSLAVVNTEAHAAWDSLLNDRHASAHGEGAKLTIADFAQAFEEALTVLEVLAIALRTTRSYARRSPVPSDQG